MVSLWISGFLFYHVLPDAVEYLAGIFQCAGSETGGNSTVDLQGSLALGISRNPPSPRRCPVCLWILQRHADLHDPWFFHYGFVQASKLVRILSHGDYDPADLQGKTKRSESLTFFVLSCFSESPDLRIPASLPVPDPYL